MLRLIQRAVSRLLTNIEIIYKISMLAVLVWIGFSLQEIATNVYSGPSAYSDDVLALQDISEKLDDIKNTVTFK